MRPTSYDDKYVQAIAELERTAILEGNYAPPLHKALKRLGLSVRPPHYERFGFNWLITGIPFALLWGIFMWMISWNAQDVPVSIALFAAFMAGFLFGLALAYYYRWSAQKHQLSRWQDL